MCAKYIYIPMAEPGDISVNIVNDTTVIIGKYVCVEDTYMYAIHDGEFLCLTMCELTRQGAFSSAFYRFASLCRVCYKRVPDGHTGSVAP